MSLSDKLQRAETERLIKAGILPSEAAFKPERDENVAADEAPLWDPIKIEVRPLSLFTVAELGPESTELPPPGSHPCPSCSEVGKVDLVDLVGHRVHASCPRCGSMWQVRTDTPADRR